MIDAGPRDRRITIQRAAVEIDALNEPVPVWVDLARRWASQRTENAGEGVSADEITATDERVFQILWDSTLADLNAKDRVLLGSRVYAITSAIEIGRREGIEITAVARGD